VPVRKLVQGLFLYSPIWYNGLMKNNFNHGDLVAVGDVHGQIDLLFELLDAVRNTGVHLLFLGDLIDRAKRPEDDVAVLTLVHALANAPEADGLSSVEALRGNHEDMLLAAMERNGWDDLFQWGHNGGAVQVLDELEVHKEWLESQPLFRRVGSTVFVHAGLRPHVPLHKQTKNDMIWIREPFLRTDWLNIDGVDLVVHGHTANFDGEVVRYGQRLCLDTGAFLTGVLTAYNHTTKEIHQFRSGKNSESEQD
jgi:serine/threonine protein phosphatase 1